LVDVAFMPLEMTSLLPAECQDVQRIRKEFPKAFRPLTAM
jgi:hypothetical protein